MKKNLVVIGCMISIIIKAQVWQTYNVLNGLVHNNVKAIAIDELGCKWFGTYGGGICKFDGENWITYTSNNGLVCDFVRAIKIDALGNIWVGTDGGVSKFDGTNWVNYTTFDGLSNNLVYAIEVDDNNKKWFATNKGVSTFDDVNWTIYNTSHGLTNNIVTCLMIDEVNTKWFGTWGGGVSKFDGLNWITYSQSNYVNVIKQDYNKTIWFGSAAGLKQYDGTSWFNTFFTDSIMANGINTLLFDQKNNPCIGTSSSGVFLFNGKKFNNYTSINGLIGDDVNTSAVDDDGNIWIGTVEGVSVYTPALTEVLEAKSSKRIQIFPNPSTSNVNINLENSLTNTNYVLKDICGNKLRNGSITSSSLTIDISDVPKGLYVLQITGEENYYCKLIKN